MACLVFEQHLGATFARACACRSRLHLYLIGRDASLAQRGSDRLSAVKSGTIIVQLLNRSAPTAGIADDAHLPRVLLVHRQHRFKDLTVFVGQAGRIAREFDLGYRCTGRNWGFGGGLRVAGSRRAGGCYRWQLGCRGCRLKSGRTARRSRRRSCQHPSRSQPGRERRLNARDLWRRRQLRRRWRRLDLFGLRCCARLRHLQARFHRPGLRRLTLFAQSFPWLRKLLSPDPC